MIWRLLQEYSSVIIDLKYKALIITLRINKYPIPDQDAKSYFDWVWNQMIGPILDHVAGK